MIEMDLLKYHDKRVKLILNDWDKVSTRIGIILDSDNNSVTVKSQFGIEIVPITTIMRIEVLE